MDQSGGILGLLERLFTPVSVAAALVAGALLILLVEALPLRVLTHDVEAVSWKQSLGIGFAQCLALWPGFSRSAATILGGVGWGLDRRAATEFSFFLAIPVMFAATGYSLLKRYESLAVSDWGWLALCSAVSFFVAWASIRWLLQFVSTHTFRVFAWYRLVLGVVILLVVAVALLVPISSSVQTGSEVSGSLQPGTTPLRVAGHPLLDRQRRHDHLHADVPVEGA